MVSSSVLETFHNDSFLLMILCQNSTTEVSRKMPKSHLSCMSEPLRASDDIIIIIPTGTFSGNCHKTETSMVWACHTGLSILQGTLEDRRWSDWLRICWCWTDVVKEWTSLPTPELLTMASSRNDWRRKFFPRHVSPNQYSRGTDLTWTIWQCVLFSYSYKYNYFQ